MAHSTLQRDDVMVSWDKMRNHWIFSAYRISDDTGAKVKTYFNKFVGNNRGFCFTVAQLYDEIYAVCITTVQCSNIKRKLETNFEIHELPEARTMELFHGGARRQKTFRNAQEFRQFRENALLKMNEPIVSRKHEEAKNHFTQVRSAFNTKDQKDFLSFDIEVYEYDHTQVLEIGYVIVRFSPARHNREGNLPTAKVTSRKHLIIEENFHYKNKDNVPDNRDGFRFGFSEYMSMEDAVERFQEDVIGCDHILGHSVKHDDAYLRDIGVVLDKPIFDTQILETYKESLKESDKYFMRGLFHLLKEYKIDFKESDLHNAGCDAFYTMMVFLRQMEYSASEVNDIIAS